MLRESIKKVSESLVDFGSSFCADQGAMPVPSPPRLVRSKSFTAALREICAELFVLCDKNRNTFLERDEYRKVTKRVYSLFLPNVRARWQWKEMDADKDGKISLSEWLSGTEAIADFAGEEEFLKALLKWSTLEKSQKLHDMIDSEMARKKAKKEPFEYSGSSKAKKEPSWILEDWAEKENPFSATKRNARLQGPVPGGA